MVMVVITVTTKCAFLWNEGRSLLAFPSNAPPIIGFYADPLSKILRQHLWNHLAARSTRLQPSVYKDAGVDQEEARPYGDDCCTGCLGVETEL